MAELKTTIKMLQTDITAKDDTISTLVAANTALENNFKLASHKLDNISQYSRRDNLIITGISASFSEATSSETNEHIKQTADKFIELCCDKLGIEVTPSDISTAHHIKLKCDRGSNAAPIIVRFARRSIREMVYRLHFQLKNHKKSTDKSLHN